MSGHDKRWIIERYPNEEGHSYGCPQLNLMGYSSVFELLQVVGAYILFGIEEKESLSTKRVRTFTEEEIFEKIDKFFDNNKYFDRLDDKELEKLKSLFRTPQGFRRAIEREGLVGIEDLKEAEGK